MLKFLGKLFSNYDSLVTSGERLEINLRTISTLRDISQTLSPYFVQKDPLMSTGGVELDTDGVLKIQLETGNVESVNLSRNKNLTEPGSFS